MAAEVDGILGEATVIGHDIGYDLTVLAREYALAGRSWRVPRALDVGSLARVAMPTLARYSLDALCDWQEIRIERRHRATPDARAAAELFVKLIPMLRARNIRTLAEAEAACGALLDEAPRGVRTGWIVPGRESDAADSTSALARLDSFPYRHRVRDVMSAPAVTAAGALTARDALAILLEKHISSVIVTGSEGRWASSRSGTCCEPCATKRRARRRRVSRTSCVIPSRPCRRKPSSIAPSAGWTDGIRHLAVDNRRNEIVGIVKRGTRCVSGRRRRSRSATRSTTRRT
jgi:CBS domain-containing protein